MMKAILVMVGYFSFALVFGMALVATMRDERLEAKKAPADKR